MLLTDPAAAARHLDAEWLITDGAGGYACGTAADLPTRRYHGAWVACAGAEARRHLVVAGFDERIAVGGESVSLLHAHWRGLPGPSAPPVRTRFQLRPQPTFAFHHGAFAFERALQFRRATPGVQPALLVHWRNLADRPLRLAVRPLLGWCDADHLIGERADFDAAVAAQGASWGVRPSPLLPTLWITADAVAAFRSAPDWYRGFHFAIDADRGYDCDGDRYAPGVLDLDLPPRGVAVVAFALGEPLAEPTAAWDDAHAAAVERYAAAPQPADSLRARLWLAADDFLYRAPGGRLGVLAGFPWFGEWGRDAFLALPGLSLARGRPELGAEVLAGALPFLRDGLLPNIYAATPAASHYGSCDAALWFALAVLRYADGGGDAGRVAAEFVPALAAIADAYVRGTGLGMAVDHKGLLHAGAPGLNATWMDARTAAGPVTPRQGFPVEIQALWYALLAFLVERGEDRFRPLLQKCGKSFVECFWIAKGRYLADAVDRGAPDATVRPNMLVAAALARSPLSPKQRAGVVQKAEAELVTPRGLRTLSPYDPAYRGRYGGGIEARDLAYHQGTVWPWLAGFYVEAALAAATDARRRQTAARLGTWLAGFGAELDRAGLDHVSEVFDGDEPQRPGGTFAQAWNTGELLRALQLVEAAS